MALAYMIRPALLAYFGCRYLALFTLFLASQVNANDAISEHNDGWLGWYPRAQLTENERSNLPAFCSGAYRIPQIAQFSDDRIEAESDQSHMFANGDIHMTGNVVLERNQLTIQSDRAVWQENTKTAEFLDNVRLYDGNVVVETNRANATQNKRIETDNAHFSVPNIHLRGEAAHIKNRDKKALLLQDSYLTFCEPGQNDWDIKASKFEINQQENYASAWHARFRIKEIPIMYFPYYRVPLIQRRTTGFLDPDIALDGGLNLIDAQQPFYLNIAPNTDATLTSHYVKDHGFIWESQWRHKTHMLGDGELNYALLERDRLTQERRWLFNYTQQGRVNTWLTHRWVYNKVSDKRYLSELNPIAAVDRTIHLPQRGELLIDLPRWSGNVIVERYQTIDDSLSLASRPYERQPQFYAKLKPLNVGSWLLEQELQLTRFNRTTELNIEGNEQTLSGLSALIGERILSNTAISYPQSWLFGFLTPKAEYRARAYLFDHIDSAYKRQFDHARQHTLLHSPRISLDGGLFFDRDTHLFNLNYLQTFEPRALWVFSPDVDNQDRIPTFDTSRTSVNFDNLFSRDRFTGGDRLADLNQISLGITSRLLREDGLEQFTFNIGRIFYLQDRKVQLNGTKLREEDTRDMSNVLANSTFRWSDSLSFYNELEWDTKFDYLTQLRYGVRFENKHNRFLNINVKRTQTLNDQNLPTKTEHQLNIGTFWAITDSWAFIGHQLRDLREYKQNERRPESNILESLVGIEYQNCCWRAQVVIKDSSPLERSALSLFSTQRKRSYLFTLQFKGLNTLSNGVDALLKETINGYSRRRYHDYP